MNYKIAESSESQREEAALKLDRIGREILGICRDELYFSMRFMDVALSSFAYQMDAAVSPSERTGTGCISIRRSWAGSTGRTGSS